MNKYQSKIIESGMVSFPLFNNERVYMTPFFQNKGLPNHLKHWQNTVDQMLLGIKTNEPIYLMVDQSFVSKGNYQRRPGLHVDGYWVGSSHGGKGGDSHSSSNDKPSEGHSSGRGNHSSDKSKEGHSSGRGLHGSAMMSKGGHDSHKSSPLIMANGGHDSHRPGMKTSSWETASFNESEAIILASNVSASRAFDGEFKGIIKDMGDCAHIDTKNLKEVILDANKVYIGNVTCLHETLPVQEDCFRTLVRLNVPGFSF